MSPYSRSETDSVADSSLSTERALQQQARTGTNGPINLTYWIKDGPIHLTYWTKNGPIHLMYWAKNSPIHLTYWTQNGPTHVLDWRC